MAQTVKLRRSATQGAVPTTAQLSLGEIAINTYDGKVYFKQDNGTESILTLRPVNTTSDLPEGTNLYYTDARARAAVGAITKDMTGFVSRTDSSLSFDPGTRVFTLTPTTSISVYYQGTESVISSAKSITITNTSGGRYIKFNPSTGNLQELTVGAFPDFKTDLLVAYIYWDAVNAKAIIFGDERHGADRDTQWQLSKHLEQGAVWRSGGALSYSLNTESAVSLGVASPVVLADEDVVHTITHAATPSNPYEQILETTAEIPVVYLNGSSYVQTTASTIPWVRATAAYYNQITAGSGSLVAAGNNAYITYWLVATNDSIYPLKLIMGRYAHNQLSDAEAETFDGYGLPVPEIAAMYKIILQASSGYTNKVVIVQVNTLKDPSTSITGSFSASSHDLLAGRSLNNQHPISAITGLQTALDGKLATSALLSSILTVDGAASGIDADLLDGQHGSYYTNYNNLSNTPTALSDFTNDMWEVTATVPTDGTGKPAGYVWYIV